MLIALKIHVKVTSKTCRQINNNKHISALKKIGLTREDLPLEFKMTSINNNKEKKIFRKDQLLIDSKIENKNEKKSL